MKKVTLATVKSFIRKNRPNLLIRCKSRFDGMIDGLSSDCDSGFSPAKSDPAAFYQDRTQGIAGAWFVGQSRDYFSAYSKDGLVGYEVYNACGSFILAVKE